tara:strand:+ start:11555 stop:11785 length:231 start_codon:yes stop_codon:yes gene_type:complete
MRYYRPNAETFLSTTHGKLDISMMTSKSVQTLVRVLKDAMPFLPTEKKREINKIIKYSKECEIATFKRADKSGSKI